MTRLVITRSPGSELIIGDDIRVHVVRVTHQSGVPRVVLAVEAPADVSIRRAEIPPEGRSAAPDGP